MSLRKVFAVISFCVASALLFVEGLLMLFSSLGPFFPSPRIEATLHINWWGLVVAMFFFWKRSISTLILGWTFLLISSYLWWHVTDERSAVWFLYQNGLPLAFVAISHTADFLYKKELRLRLNG